jgi:hypothetical protein
MAIWKQNCVWKRNEAVSKLQCVFTIDVPTKFCDFWIGRCRRGDYNCTYTLLAFPLHIHPSCMPTAHTSFWHSHSTYILLAFPLHTSFLQVTLSLSQIPEHSSGETNSSGETKIECKFWPDCLRRNWRSTHYHNTCKTIGCEPHQHQVKGFRVGAAWF